MYLYSFQYILISKLSVEIQVTNKRLRTSGEILKFYFIYKDIFLRFKGRNLSINSRLNNSLYYYKTHWYIYYNKISFIMQTVISRGDHPKISYTLYAVLFFPFRIGVLKHFNVQTEM